MSKKRKIETVFFIFALFEILNFMLGLFFPTNGFLQSMGLFSNIASIVISLSSIFMNLYQKENR